MLAILAFFLLLKPTGGFRTIGLLSCFYPVWAKLRMALVRGWSLIVPRNFFAAGIRRSTEDAVGRLLLASEGFKPQQEAACFIWDIDKSYEHVDRARLQKAAVPQGFPLAVLRL